MSDCIDYETRPGQTIYEAAMAMIGIAKRQQAWVRTKFNGVTLTAGPGSTVEGIAKDYTGCSRVEPNPLAFSGVWIPVQERLPEPRRSVLVVDLNSVTEGFWWSEAWDSDHGFLCNVTHWAEKPQPPKL